MADVRRPLVFDVRGEHRSLMFVAANNFGEQFSQVFAADNVRGENLGRFSPQRTILRQTLLLITVT
ncbi:MAG: hypothetical protein GY774_32000 [Planctomycetes bacterium]|nr:hypothetical protein [Planctomycetota bacterium]